MKKFFTLCILLILVSHVYAQAPNAFSFQGVAKGADGKVLAVGTNINVRCTVREGSLFGTPIFQETHFKTISASGGIFNLAVGSGSVVSGVFSEINWYKTAHYLQVEIDVQGGSNFVDVGTTQFLSVPYSMHSATTDGWKPGEPIVQRGEIGAGGILQPLANGTQLIWYPRKASFRAGFQANGVWDEANIAQFSFGVGKNTKASNVYSAAFGENSEATGIGSTAFGRFSKAQGESSVALGDHPIAVGNYSVSIGSETQALGAQSFASGLTTTAIGVSSVAFGTSTSARGDASFTVGEGTIARNFGAVSIGSYNDQQGNVIGTKAGAAATDRIFQIGNGSSLQSTSNALTVLRNGNIGIGKGILNPTHVMDISGRIRMRQNGGATAGIYFDSPNPDFPQIGFVGMKDNYEIGLYINNHWAFGATAAGAEVYGSLYVSGVVQEGSDRRWKKNIVSLNNSFERIRNIKGYNYHWIDESKGKGLQTGVIAQEVEEVFPELVKTDEKGFKSVNYSGFIPHLIEAVKELKRENDALKAENGSLKKETQTKLAALEARLDALSRGLSPEAGK